MKVDQALIGLGQIQGSESGLLPSSLGVIGGYWPERAEHLWLGSARLSM